MGKADLNEDKERKAIAKDGLHNSRQNASKCVNVHLVK
jgi:hypothetical protein